MGDPLHDLFERRPVVVADLRRGLVELGQRPVGGDAQRHPGLSRAVDLVERDALRGQRIRDPAAGVAAEQRDGMHLAAEAVRRARRVERLAAGHRHDAVRPVDRAQLQRLDLVLAVDRRRCGDEGDHASARASSSVGCAAVPPARRVLSAPHAHASVRAASSPSPPATSPDLAASLARHLSAQPRREKARIERVARAGAVHHVDARRRDPRRLAAADGQRSVRPELDDDERPAGGQRARRGLDVAVLAAGQPQRLLGVGQQDVERVDRDVPALARIPAGVERRGAAHALRQRSQPGRQAVLQERRGDVDVPRAFEHLVRYILGAQVRQRAGGGQHRAIILPHQPDAHAGRGVHGLSPPRRPRPRRRARRGSGGRVGRRRRRRPSPRRGRACAAPAARIAPEPPSTSSAWSTSCSRWPNLGTMSPPRRTRSAFASPTTSRSISRAGRGRARRRARPATRRRPCGSSPDRATPTRSGPAARPGGPARGPPPAPLAR